MEFTINDLMEKVRLKLGITNRRRGKLLELFRNKMGIEIGGPSPIFSSQLPIYLMVKSLDGCNFSQNTIWEGAISEGTNYNYFSNKIGYQYICEASELKSIDSNKYDFLLASHCLEHCANTFKTLSEWLRVIKPGGCILLILPDKRFTFDHKRPVTTFEHLIQDAEKGIDEKDLTHLNEVLSLHDLSLDLAAGNFDSFKQRSLDNYSNRCLHHHVFDFALLIQIFNWFKIKVIHKEFIRPYHQVIAGVKQ